MRRELLVLVFVANVAGCGLINALSGEDADTGGIDCDVDGLCSCPNSPETDCLGEGCVCDDNGELACSDSETICSLIDDDGCANDGCVCHDQGSGACVCEEAPGTCSTDRGSIALTDASNEACIGECTCSLTEGCACLGSACAYGVDGAGCNTDDDCRALQMATDVDCSSDADCAFGDVCGRVTDNETGCFASRSCESGEVEVPIETVSGDLLTVCVNGLAEASCEDNVCTGSLSE